MGSNGQLNGTSAYSRFHIPLNPEPLHKARRLRVVCIGAGFAGLTLAYKVNIEKCLGDIIDFQIYERNVCARSICRSSSPLTRS